MWHLRNKIEDYRGREEKMKQDETREGDKHKRLLILANKLRVARVEWVGRDGVAG